MKVLWFFFYALGLDSCVVVVVAFELHFGSDMMCHLGYFYVICVIIVRITPNYKSRAQCKG
jgi:hypothetical protein